jgi:penicillin-binding protein 2
VSRRSMRHPLRRSRMFPRSAVRKGRPDGRGKQRVRLRMRPRRSVNVAALVASPEEVPSRPRVRMRVVGAIVLVLFGVMALRLWDLQVINRSQYASAINQNSLRTVTVPAPRGLIVDRKDTVLAGNKVENEVVLSRAEAATNPAIVGKVAALCGITPAAVRAALTDLQYSPYEPVPVLQNATPSVVQYLGAHQSQFPGVTVVQVTVRDYPQGGTTGTQVLGYAGPITATTLKKYGSKGYSQTSQIGKTGVEAEEEPYLRGKPGLEKLEVTPTGTPVGVVSKTKPVQGDTVELNLTAGLQKYAQQALTQDMTQDRTHLTFGHYPKAPNGAVVVMNVETGGVLAMASNPSYSLTTWVGGISTASYDALRKGCTVATGGCPLNDYAMQGLYTPGSTFKLATATAALQDGLITTTSFKDDTGIFTVRAHGDPTCTSGCTFHDATAFDAGVITVRLALTESDDFFFYTLGLQFWLGRHQFGNTAIQKVAHEYGFGDLTGIDLPGEVQGRVDSQPVREKLHKLTPKGYPNTTWYPGTNIEMAFGQGGTVITPLEEAEAYATFADHGIRHQPEVVGAIVTPDGKVVKRVAPKVTGHVTISPGNWQAMLTGFIGATHSPKGTATATFAQDLHVPSNFVIAGKTGTATTATSTTIRSPNAWFVGFGPIGAPTEYVVAVAVAQAGYGAVAAAPAVASIFNYLYTNPPSTTLTIPTVTHQPSLTASKSNPAAGTPTSTIPSSAPSSAPSTTPPSTPSTPATPPPVTAPPTTTTPPPTTTTTPPPTTTPTTTTTTTTTTTPPSTTPGSGGAATAAAASSQKVQKVRKHRGGGRWTHRRRERSVRRGPKHKLRGDRQHRAKERGPDRRRPTGSAVDSILHGVVVAPRRGTADGRAEAGALHRW